jgi:hypothetical protein
MEIKEANLRYQTYGLGSFFQGLDEEDMERLLRIHIRFVSISFEFSLIHMLGMFPSSLCTFALACIF